MKWTRVEDALPELGARVLCKCRANIYEVLKWTVDGWEHDPQQVYMSGFVTHWMPLPEPRREPIRPKHWIVNYDEGTCTCPACKTEYDSDDNPKDYWNYCPQCGAKMNEKENEK